MLVGLFVRALLRLRSGIPPRFPGNRIVAASMELVDVGCGDHKVMNLAQYILPSQTLCSSSERVQGSTCWLLHPFLAQACIVRQCQKLPPPPFDMPSTRGCCKKNVFEPLDRCYSNHDSSRPKHSHALHLGTSNWAANRVTVREIVELSLTPRKFEALGPRILQNHRDIHLPWHCVFLCWLRTGSNGRDAELALLLRYYAGPAFDGYGQ